MGTKGTQRLNETKLVLWNDREDLKTFSQTNKKEPTNLIKR